MREPSATTCDSSVLLPALSPLHPAHEVCLRAMVRVGYVPAHVLLETYSVLTRFGGEAQVPPAHAAEVLTGQPWRTLQLPAEAYEPLLQSFAEADRPGGAIYDGQIAATAKHFGLVLLSRDHRAAKTYELVGAEYELI